MSPDDVIPGDSTNVNEIRQDPDEQRLIGGDAAYSKMNIVVGRLLMARLEIEHLTGPPPAAVGETFMISLHSGVNADFPHKHFIPLTQGAHSSGIVTITSAAIPASGTLGVLLAGNGGKAKIPSAIGSASTALPLTVEQPWQDVLHPA